MRNSSSNTAFAVLRQIDQETAGCTGQEFFNRLVRCLALALNANCAFISKFSDDHKRAYVRAFWRVDQLIDNFEYELSGTPCEVVLDGEIVAYSCNIQSLFPLDRRDLAKIDAESYLAIPLRVDSGKVCGHLAVIDDEARDWSEYDFGVLRIFASRGTAEFERMDYEQHLQENNAELTRLRELADAANKAKSDFLASMSHELRTPLNGILGYAQLLLRDESLDREQQHTIAAIERCGEHLLLLISDVLDLARIEAGRLELHPSDFNLREFLGAVADMIRVQAMQAGLQFRYETQGPLPDHLRVDSRRLKQILLNLLGNAVKFTDHGSISFRVISEPQAGHKQLLRFEIEDTGIGIVEQLQEQIFELFHQAGTQRQRSGAGLGLTISRRLARAMGGDIHVQSRIGQGSLFTVEVLAVESRSVAVEAPVAPRIRAYRGPRRRVLVADDNSDNREILTILLRSVGFDVLECSDGRQVLELAHANKIDLVMLDLVMPVMDGFEAVRQMRQISQLAAIPVIALSASTFEHTRDDAFSAGFQAFLAKPIKIGEVFDALADALSLQWVHAAAKPTVTPHADSAPARTESEKLSALWEFARSGDVKNIQVILEELEQQAAFDPILLAQLRKLTQSFDMQGLRNAMEDYSGISA